MFFDITFLPGSSYYTLSTADYEVIRDEVLSDPDYAQFAGVLNYFEEIDGVYYAEMSNFSAEQVEFLNEFGLGLFTYNRSKQSNHPYL